MFANLGALVQQHLSETRTGKKQEQDGRPSPSTRRLSLSNLLRPFSTRTQLDDLLTGQSSNTTLQIFEDGVPNTSSKMNSHGLASGTVLELFGKPHSGKTTVCLSAAVEALSENLHHVINTVAELEISSRRQQQDQRHLSAGASSELVYFPHSTHVVWVSACVRHPFSPSLLLSAVEEAAVEALEAFYTKREQQSTPFDFASPLLLDPALLARHVVDKCFHFYGEVQTPYSFFALAESLEAQRALLGCSEGPTNDPQHLFQHSKAEDGCVGLWGLQNASRVLFVFDCFASVLSSIESAPLLSAAASAFSGGLRFESSIASQQGGKREGEEQEDEAIARSKHDTRSMNNIVSEIFDSCEVGGAYSSSASSSYSASRAQAHQFTVQELKRAINALVSSWSFGGFNSPSAKNTDRVASALRGVCVILTNIATAAGGGGTAVASSLLQRPLGGVVWSSLATLHVHVALIPLAGPPVLTNGEVAEETHQRSLREGESCNVISWRHIFTIM